MSQEDLGQRNNVILPGGGETSEENAQNRFERTFLLFAADEQSDAVLANFITHAEFIKDQLGTVESIDTGDWVAFLESLEEENQDLMESGGSLPAWNYDQYSCLTADLRRGTVEDGFSPQEITDLYLSWIEERARDGGIDDVFDIGGEH